MTKALLHNLGQSLSFGHLSLLGKVLWPMLLASSDDQGRGSAEADPLKWYVCPNVPELTQDNIPSILEEMASPEIDMIVLYRDSRGRKLYQIRRWWEYQQMQWAQPSKYEAPEGWTDRVRANIRGGAYIQEGWDTTGGFDAALTNNGKSLQEEPPTSPPINAPENPPGNIPGTTNKPNLTKPKPTKTQEPANAGAAKPPIPTNLDGWLDLIAKTRNTGAVLCRMHAALYPIKDPQPSYGYCSKTANAVGGPERLVRLLWMSQEYDPAGDVLAYCLEMHRGKKGKPRPPSRYHQYEQGSAQRQLMGDET